MDYRTYLMPYSGLLYDEMQFMQNYDTQYLMEMYPTAAKIVYEYVEDEIRNQDYRGSFIYDEYPDKLMFRMMCKNIRDRMEKDGEYRDESYDDIIEILLLHEMYKRRQRRRMY